MLCDDHSNRDIKFLSHSNYSPGGTVNEFTIVTSSKRLRYTINVSKKYNLNDIVYFCSCLLSSE